MTDVSSFRALTSADLEAVHALSVGVRWPHRLEDWRLFHEVGYGIVATDERRALVASGMWWPFGTGLATVGMVIVEPGLRGKGVGRRMMQALLKAAGDRTVRLTATAAGRHLYESLGFQVTGSNSQRNGIADAGLVRDDPDVRAAGARDWAVIAAIDAAATGGDRSLLLKALERAGTTSVLERGGRVRGYAICRPFGQGHVVGPLVCADDADAIALAGPHLRAHAGRFLRMDTPKTDGAFASFLAASGLVDVDRSVVMARGVPAAPGASRSVSIHALASQALG